MRNYTKVLALPVPGFRRCPKEGIDYVLPKSREETVCYFQHIEEYVQLYDRLALNQMVHHVGVDVHHQNATDNYYHRFQQIAYFSRC